MDEDDDPETNQAGRLVNEPNNSAQMPFSAPPEKEDPPAKRELKAEGKHGSGTRVNRSKAQLRSPTRKRRQRTICYFSNYRLIQFMGNVFFDQNRFKKNGLQKLHSHNAFCYNY